MANDRYDAVPTCNTCNILSHNTCSIYRWRLIQFCTCSAVGVIRGSVWRDSKLGSFDADDNVDFVVVVVVDVASTDGDQYDAVTTCSDGGISVCNCNLKFDEAKI